MRGKLSAFCFLFLAFSFLFFPAHAHAASCEDVSFSDADICVSIDKISTTQFRVQTDITNQSSNTLAITCDLMTPDSVLRNVGSCNGTFSYTKRSNGTVVIYMTVNGENRTIEKNYDFVDGDWTNASSNTSNGDLDNFYLTTDDSSPTISQWVDLTIKARDSSNDTVTDYTDMVNFTVYYRSSSSSSRTQTTSSSYYEIDADYVDGYDFTSSDDGLVTLTNLIKFTKNNYDYKVRVYDENDSSIYKEITFTVSVISSSNNGDLDNFYVTTDDASPSTSQWVDLTIKAQDSSNNTVTDYTDMVNFTVYYRSSSTSSRTQTTSSSYYEIDADYVDGYDFTSSDDGIVTLTNLIKFKKNNYDYKVRVYDNNDSSIYKEITFSVGSAPSSSNEFTIAQIAQIRTMYTMRPTLITNLRQQYPNLKTNTSWQNQASDLYIQMSAIIHGSISVYTNYHNFLQGFRDWYVYTLQVR